MELLLCPAYSIPSFPVCAVRWMRADHRGDVAIKTTLTTERCFLLSLFRAPPDTEPPSSFRNGTVCRHTVPYSTVQLLGRPWISFLAFRQTRSDVIQMSEVILTQRLELVTVTRVGWLGVLGLGGGRLIFLCTRDGVFSIASTRAKLFHIELERGGEI